MKKFRAFTLLEIIIVIVVISSGLLSIIYYIQNTLKQVHQANQKVIALNLAKEGLEAVYYARNERVLTHSGTNLGSNGEGKETNAESDRSRCWLALDSSKCLNDKSILGSGNYNISITKDKNTIKVVFSGIKKDINFTEGNIYNENKEYALYLSGDVRTTQAGSKNDNITRYGRFFRKLEGKGIYGKVPSDTFLNCQEVYNNSNPNCRNNSPKEYRFCSVVKYATIGQTPSEVKLCGIITNFFPNVNQEG